MQYGRKAWRGSGRVKPAAVVPRMMGSAPIYPHFPVGAASAAMLFKLPGHLPKASRLKPLRPWAASPGPASFAVDHHRAANSDSGMASAMAA